MPDASSPDVEPSPGDDHRPSAPAVMIVGASARAAAFSSIRAGLRPVCIDQFADLDLQSAAEAVRVKDYPAGIPLLIERFSPMPVIYTGALENHPQILQEIALKRPLLGNDATTVTAVRDPVRVHDALKRAKVPVLSVRTAEHPPPDGNWMLKPIAGAAGRGIAVWDERAAGSSTFQEPHYFQKRAEGEPISAVFVAHQDPFNIRYVGLTRQLIGLNELHAPPFAWCGSIGPVALDVGGEILVRRIGSVIAHRFGLRGLFGCDFILTAPDRPLLTEVNPRYTGSVEVLEMLCGLNLLRDHCVATGMSLPDGLQERILEAPTGATVGKVVLYAHRHSTAPDTTSWVRMTPIGPVPALADIPSPGSAIPQGSPVCTIVAAAASEGECRRYLLRRATEISRLL